MQSKNVLLLGLLFVLLLTAFCVAKYIDDFYPDVQTITTPTTEVLENEMELHPIPLEEIEQIAQIPTPVEEEEVDNDYIQVIKLIEQEERDVQEAYHQALMLEAAKNRAPKKNSVLKKESKRVPPKAQKAQKKIEIETVLENKILDGMGRLSSYDKEKLKEIASYLKKTPHAYLQIEAGNKTKKIYQAKRYLTMLGILSKDIRIENRDRKNRLISSLDTSDIEILLIKKD